MDLQRKQSLPSNKLATVMAKFDEMKTSGKMMPTATLAVGTMEGRRIVCWRKLIWLSLSRRLICYHLKLPVLELGAADWWPCLVIKCFKLRPTVCCELCLLRINTSRASVLSLVK